MANILIKGIEMIINGFLLPFNAVISGLNLIPGVYIPKLKVTIPKIPKLATGTNFIPKEGLYHLHQGEAVVPKKYNPEADNRNANNNSNSEIINFTNELKVNGRVFAREIIQDLNNEAKRLGYKPLLQRR